MLTSGYVDNLNRPLIRDNRTTPMEFGFLYGGATIWSNSPIVRHGGRNGNNADFAYENGRKAFSTCTPASATSITRLAPPFPLLTVEIINKPLSRHGKKP